MRCFQFDSFFLSFSSHFFSLAVGVCSVAAGATIAVIFFHIFIRFSDFSHSVLCIVTKNYLLTVCAAWFWL